MGSFSEQWILRNGYCGLDESTLTFRAESVDTNREVSSDSLIGTV